jgi:hypothetical protein
MSTFTISYTIENENSSNSGDVRLNEHSTAFSRLLLGRKRRCIVLRRQNEKDRGKRNKINLLYKAPFISLIRSRILFAAFMTISALYFY